ncbi:MAG: hypothetical protein HC831_18505 [Chloroflexia bacterium]|nr:hypothetical protein [Chloroflexia bacterium]
MAKKKKTPTDGVASSFDAINDILGAINPNGAMMDINPIAKIDEWISTGNYILNAVLSGSLFGGLPNRRSLVLAGEEGCLEKNQEVEIYRLRNKNISQHHELKDLSTGNS